LKKIIFLFCLFLAGAPPPPGSFEQYILAVGGGAVRCTLCNKTSSTRSNLKKHIENIHFPNTYTYTCRYCGDTFSTRNTHYIHVHRVHNKNLQ
jgi:hypothetical protein